MNGKYALIVLALLIGVSGCAEGYVQISEEPQRLVITVLFGQSTSDPGLEDMLIDKINSKFPEISLIWESVDWGDHFSIEMQSRLASGEVPDIIIGKAQDVAAYKSSGYLAQFDSSFYSGIKEDVLESVTVDGRVYGLPYNIFVQGVLYNKNIFWRYGLEPPKTLAEMDNVLARLNEVRVTPFATHFRESWYVSNVSMQYAVNQVFLDNPFWGDEFRAGSRSFQTSEEYAKCYMQVKTLLDNSWSDAMTVNQYECVRRFASQEAAMFMTGTWSLQILAGMRPDLQIGIFPYPNEDGTAKLLVEPNLTFMKNSQGEHIDVVDAIIKSIFSDMELAGDIFEFTKTTSALKDVEVASMRQIENDINAFADAYQTIDVTIGNRQLVWRFQDACATQVYSWLEGRIGFEDVLRFADENRTESGAIS